MCRRVQNRRRGHPQTFIAFDIRADAEAWARQIESEMDRCVFVCRLETERNPITELLDRYKWEITLGKRTSLVDEFNPNVSGSRLFFLLQPEPPEFFR